MRWLTPLASRAWLWKLDQRSAALGMAIGVFFGMLLLPAVQIFLAAIAAWLLRANLPLAIAGTFISNPFTAAPIVLAAHGLGLRMLDQDASLMPRDTQSWMDVLGEHSLAIAVGLLVVAAIGALIAYIVIWIAWQAETLFRARRMRDAASSRAAGPRC